MLIDDPRVLAVPIEESNEPLVDLIALAVVGFAAGSPDNSWPPYAPDGDPIPQTLRFILPAMTFLTGFSLVAILAEDANMSPRRTATAVVATVAIAGTFYCVVLLASAWIIPWRRPPPSIREP